MAARSLADWLRWQDSLHPRSVELGLGRVREVGERLGCLYPPGTVFTVTGTNGKGSTAALLEEFERRGGARTGLYTSPHLLAYNERIRVDGQPVSDESLIAAFERVESARAGSPLTFFEFGTLAALDIFRDQGAESWVLEVGMGGRLDAVNAVDADYAVITTVDLDHQSYLGDTVEAIAAEKAGIMRPGRPVFYGDWPVPQAIRGAAARTGAELLCLGEHFDFTPSRPCWGFRGQRALLEGLAYPHGATAAQLRNISVAMAIMERHRPAAIAGARQVDDVVALSRPRGRFEINRTGGGHEWVLDVAHNPQAAATLHAQLATLQPAVETTIVLGMLGDKALGAFVAALQPVASRWIVCDIDDARARPAQSIAAEIEGMGLGPVLMQSSPEHACEAARQRTRPGGRIVVCGSFRVVGPAMRWLGVY